MFTKVRKKIILLSFSVFALLGLGFGCSGATAEEQALIKPVTLNYWTIYNNVSELRKIAENYKRIRPYVTVNIRQVRADEFDKLFTNALADDVSPDIVSLHVRWLGQYASRLYPMPEKVKMATVVTTGTYFPKTTITPEEVLLPTLQALKSSYVNTAYNDITLGGTTQVWGMPLALDTLAIYYNKDLLDKAGIPEPPKTWQEFMEAVKASTKVDKDGNFIQSGVALGTGANIDNAFDILTLFMLQSGVKMQDKNYLLFASGLDRNRETHPTVKAMNFYTDFARADKDVYSWNEKMGNALENFASGRSVFYFGFAYDLPRIRTLGPQLNIETIQIPQLNESLPVDVASYWVESVPKKSKHKNEAWDFVRFITAAGNVRRYTTAVKQPSPFRSQINEQKKDILLSPFANLVLNAENWYRGRDYETAKKTFTGMIDTYIAPVAEGENEVRARTDAIIYASRIIQQTM